MILCTGNPADQTVASTVKKDLIRLILPVVLRAMIFA
jgi:hypothetical protein